MTDILPPPSANSAQASSIDANPNVNNPELEEKPQRERDEIFWTELEIRRLGNLVAECIHARRYIGDTQAAEEERHEMRKYIDAMKRKAMRVLHRAELYASSGHSAWPGIDATITDPVSLAEEYVRVVQNYEAVLSEEESRAREVRKEKEEAFGIEKAAKPEAEIGDLDREEENWEAADSAAYKEALRKEKELSANSKRNDLLGVDNEGIRRRKAEAGASSSSEPPSYSKEDEELMSRHQPIQDELTSNLVDLVGQLKESVTSNNDKLSKDNKVLDATEDALENNLSKIAKQGSNLESYSRSASVSWWVMLIAVIVAILVFIFVGFLLTIPM